MDQFNDFKASKDKMEPKIEIYAKKLSKIGPTKNFLLTQKLKSTVNAGVNWG